jgi:hypothetical protein
MLKVSFFQGQTEYGPSVVPLFGPADSVFEKVAAPGLLPEVASFIAGLRPRDNAQYVLVNAMGASEYYGSNVNGDHFPENALIHRPDDWAHNPVIDKVKAAAWPYGFPTFYDAQVFAHHRNKDSAKGFGGIELAAWNPHMRRVELVTRLDKDRCAAFGGQGTWDKLKAGDFPDVSMGTKVPFDTCSICLDSELYQTAWATFEPGRHKSPGEAILAFHRKRKEQDGVGIRGLSITRKDYCEHARTQMNLIYPDGRKVWVFNDFPRFFDISYVFIGADKIAKAMMKIAEDGKNYFFMGSAEMAEKLGAANDNEQVKTASIATVEDLFNWNKQAKQKKGEIIKDVVPSQFAGKAVSLLTNQEPDLPRETLDALGRVPLDRALATTGGLGMVLRPREFQRIVLCHLGEHGLADEFDTNNQTFSKTDEVEEMPLSEEAFHPILARMLLPLLAERSALGPIIEKRVVVAGGKPTEDTTPPSSHPSELLRKIGAAYNGYRHSLMNLASSSQSLLEKTAGPREIALHKIASAPVDEVFTPLSFMYLKEAFMNELPLGDTDSVMVNIMNNGRVQRAGV